METEADSRSSLAPFSSHVRGRTDCPRAGYPTARVENEGHTCRPITRKRRLTVRRALESAGVEFIDENGGGPGVRLRKRHHKKELELGPGCWTAYSIRAYGPQSRQRVAPRQNTGTHRRRHGRAYVKLIELRKRGIEQRTLPTIPGTTRIAEVLVARRRAGA
jgi:hypothetical protein